MLRLAVHGAATISLSPTPRNSLMARHMAGPGLVQTYLAASISVPVTARSLPFRYFSPSPGPRPPAILHEQQASPTKQTTSPTERSQHVNTPIASRKAMSREEKRRRKSISRIMAAEPALFYWQYNGRWYAFPASQKERLILALWVCYWLAVFSFAWVVCKIAWFIIDCAEPGRKSHAQSSARSEDGGEDGGADSAVVDAEEVLFAMSKVLDVVG